MNASLNLRGLVDAAVVRHKTSVRQLGAIAKREGFKVTYTTLNQIRSGTYKSVPSEVTIRAIAWLAGVDASVAFTAAGQPVPGPPFAEELPPGVDHLPPKARKAAIDMLRVLVDMNQDTTDAANNRDQEQPANSSGNAAELSDARPGQKTAADSIDPVWTQYEITKTSTPDQDAENIARSEAKRIHRESQVQDN